MSPNLYQLNTEDFKEPTALLEKLLLLLLLLLSAILCEVLSKLTLLSQGTLSLKALVTKTATTKNDQDVCVIIGARLGIPSYLIDKTSSETWQVGVCVNKFQYLSKRNNCQIQWNTSPCEN